MTWEDFMDGVKASYWIGGEPSDAAMLRAVADYAQAIYERQIEGDLQMAKSFRDSYNEQKNDLAGARIAASAAAVNASVRELLPIAADTDNAQALLDNAISSGLSDFNGGADMFDKLVLDAAIDLQRHIPFYQGRQETTYLEGGSGVENLGFVSAVTPPDGFRIQQVYYGSYREALAEGVAYEVDEYVESNGRIYTVITGGTLNAGQLGGGLTSTDYNDDETLGGLVFQYRCPVSWIPARNFTWADRGVLRAGRLTMGALYSLSPQADAMWFYPALDANHRFILEWSGVKTSFADADLVSFDEPAMAAAAQYVRYMLAKDVRENGPAASAALAMYQSLLRKCVIDNQARDTGATNKTVAANDTLDSQRFAGALPWRVCASGGSGGSDTDNFPAALNPYAPIGVPFLQNITQYVGTGIDALLAIPTTSLTTPYIVDIIIDGVIERWSLEANATGDLPNDYNATTNIKSWHQLG